MFKSLTDLYAISDEALAARLQQAEKTCNALHKELAEVHQEVKQMKTQMNSQRTYVAESMLRVYDHVATHMSAMTRDMVGVQKVVNAEGRYTEGLNDLLEKVVVYMGKAPPGLFLRAVGPEGQHLRDGMLEGVGTSQGDADASKQFKKGKKRAVDEPADEMGASSSKRARGI
ncbi:hypothetical protein NLJ89_g8995 [Agrocybe chaxingu]|uniref:Uncharacterized protein n=1 Tax=Agrocybe chaxingu TaxID=84603 RepID=A0A9W8MS97_9AGAR|nr:hypothetical protein NLJ89_g8995 [Agrocybe chaxingu]